MRVMEIAERFGFPVISLVDTPGAYPGVAAEQHGQGGAIARSQAEMARLTVPTVACIIGEGGSGGAVAIAVSDRVLMQENAIYSVITPEGCAAILWRDAGEAKKAAAAFKPDALHCLELGVIDGDRRRAARAAPRPTTTRRPGSCGRRSSSRSRSWRTRPGEELRRRRRAKFRGMGVFATFATQSRAFHIIHRVFNRYNPLETRRGPPAAGLVRLTPRQGSQARAFCPDSAGGKRSPARQSEKRSAVSLSEYRRKRDPKKTPEPFAAGAEPSSQQPIFVVQRHDARRAPLRLPARAQRRARVVGRAEGRTARAWRPGARRPRRGSPARVRDLPRRDPAGPVRRRHGRDLGQRHLRAARGEAGRPADGRAARLAAATGAWSLVPAHLDGKEQNWLLIKGHDDGAEARPARTYRPMLATLAEAHPARRRLGLRGEVRRLPRARVYPRRRLPARSRGTATT